MSLELAFELLHNRLVSLGDEVEELHINAEQFFPPAHASQKTNGHNQNQRPPSPVESLGENAIALKGDLQETFAALKRGLSAIRPPRNLRLWKRSIPDPREVS